MRSETVKKILKRTPINTHILVRKCVDAIPRVNELATQNPPFLQFLECSEVKK